jgi:hypothetical protein
MTSKRLLALILGTAVVAGCAGAATFSAWGQPAVPLATGFGPDDRLTRYVLTATSGTASDDLLAELERTDGVVNAQRLSDGRAFVARVLRLGGQRSNGNGRARAGRSPVRPDDCKRRPATNGVRAPCTLSPVLVRPSAGPACEDERAGQSANAGVVQW